MYTLFSVYFFAFDTLCSSEIITFSYNVWFIFFMNSGSIKLHGQYFAHYSKSFFEAGVYRGSYIVTTYFMMSSPNAYLNASLI
jgi:hypothetical protein